MVMLVGNRYQMVAGLTALWFACCVNSPAQVTTAGINGVITDSQGLAVPAVRLLVVNESTGQKFDTVTNETGNYFVRSLPVDTMLYRLRRRDSRAISSPASNSRPINWHALTFSSWSELSRRLFPSRRKCPRWTSPQPRWASS